VGLLQVADGALSQVTSLLNRAVTLATEASNGTLNSSQDTAANQEYQSILSEISNIGTTTTYNDAAVFNSNTNIYTGDSSAVGSSVDDLNIRSLSSSNVGDTGGTMAYTSGANNGRRRRTEDSNSQRWHRHQLRGHGPGNDQRH
jgi:flagellin